uniref:Uncharacterized protein n=1 Tax=Anopheles funestus TaxID=62324 RepID=A0A182R8H2_ANOFN
MECSNRKGQFPLIDLAIRGLKKIRFWNETPGQSFPTVGLIIVISYPITWLVPGWLFIVTSQDDLTHLIKAVNEQIVFFVVFFKLFIFSINFRRWEPLFYDLQRAYTSVMDNPNMDVQRIIGHVEKSSYYLTKWYGILMSMECAVYGILPIILVAVNYAITGSYDVPLLTPLEANYFIPGYRTNFWIWLPFDIVLNVVLQIHGIAIFLTECFTWNLIHATSCLFKVLQLQAEELSDESGRKDECRELKFTRFVTLHDSVLRVARTLEQILRIPILLLYMSTILALCLMLIVLSLAFEDVYLLTIMVSTLGYCLFQIFSFSYLGTELIVESGAVADAIFHSTWYNQNVQRQKEICFVVMRANKPVCLTAGKLFTVTRDSFTEVIKQAYTVFTLMSQFLNDSVN